MLDAREERLLQIEEERLVTRSDATLLVTRNEADLLCSRLKVPAPAKVHALRNGIDTAGYDPQAVEPHAALVSAPGPHLVTRLPRP